MAMQDKIAKWRQGPQSLQMHGRSSHDGRKHLVSIFTLLKFKAFSTVPLITYLHSVAKSWKEQFGEGDQFVTVSPDAGGVERARAFAKRIAIRN